MRRKPYDWVRHNNKRVLMLDTVQKYPKGIASQMCEAAWAMEVLLPSYTREEMSKLTWTVSTPENWFMMTPDVPGYDSWLRFRLVFDITWNGGDKISVTLLSKSDGKTLTHVKDYDPHKPNYVWDIPTQKCSCLRSAE